MSNNQNTPCGCRSNSANDTWHKAPVATGEFKASMIYPVATVELLVTVLGELSNSVSESNERGKRCAHGVGVCCDSLADIDARGLSKEHRASDLEVFYLRIADVLLDAVKLCQQIGVHSSSPVVAESEADTSDAPAMTVQEGGGSDAAPGVEGVSPASSTPRFVAVGEYVYDRARNLVAGGWPAAVARKWARDLNADLHVAGYMEREDAK